MVSVNSSVPQERPVSPDCLQMVKVDFGCQDLLFIGRCLREYDSLWIGDER